MHIVVTWEVDTLGARPWTCGLQDPWGTFGGGLDVVSLFWNCQKTSRTVARETLTKCYFQLSQFWGEGILTLPRTSKLTEDRTQLSLLWDWGLGERMMGSRERLCKQKVKVPR